MRQRAKGQARLGGHRIYRIASAIGNPVGPGLARSVAVIDRASARSYQEGEG